MKWCTVELTMALKIYVGLKKLRNKNVYCLVAPLLGPFDAYRLPVWSRLATRFLGCLL